MRRATLATLMLLGLAGCAGGGAGPVAKPAAEAEAPALSKAQQEAAQGIQAYENGQYKEAQQSLKNALDAGLPAKPDQVAANKYLAFMACASRQREACKGYFRKALAIDPKFDLTPAEAGHPLWGAVFKGVKAEGQKKGG